MSQYTDGFAQTDVQTTTPSGVSDEQPKEGYMALLALSHTAVEHRLYVNMLQNLTKAGLGVGAFTIRSLMRMTGLSSYSSIRRACSGLVEKLSVDAVAADSPIGECVYRVFEPREIFARRIASGIAPYPEEIADLGDSDVFKMIGENVMKRGDLSRREAMVALLCAEGLSNAAIGKKLTINEKTVKYHLRHVFIKLGVRRRTELVGCLLKGRNGNQTAWPTPVH